MEARIHFYVDYKLATRVKFKLLGERKGKARAKKYVGLSRNICAEGIRFCSPKKLKIGDRLFIELFLPQRLKSIPMTGQVRWSERIYPTAKGIHRFDTGIRLITVKRKSVVRSIHIDRKYKVAWSIVLDSVFGEFSRYLHRTLPKARPPGAWFK
jgi:Tfp pilus assembly protein PilZ